MVTALASASFNPRAGILVSGFTREAVTSVAAVLVGVEPLSRFRKRGRLLRLHREIRTRDTDALAGPRDKIGHRGLRGIERFLRLRHGRLFLGISRLVD